jgi:lipopolysaccharide/colanic/teichoic acid biosynthesis glycosyltransferase
MYVALVKPAFDFIASLMLVLALSWLQAGIWLVYLVSLSWPPLFLQDRLGRNMRVFTLIKFRTLKADAQRPLQERRFAWGDFLRRSGLDELPQLVQVLAGQMSLVGPRPRPVEYRDAFTAQQRKRFEVKPGITGWCQVNGRHSIPWEKKLDLDVYYSDHVSFLFDLKILIRTVALVLRFAPDRSLDETSLIPPRPPGT